MLNTTKLKTILSIVLMCIVSSSFAKDGAIKNFNFFEVVKNRHSVRKYKSTPVPKDHLEKIINAARLAPTAGNQQPWKFVIIQSKQKINQLKERCIAGGMERVNNNKDLNEDQKKKRIEGIKQSVNNYLSAPAYIIVLTDSTSKYPGYNEKDGTLAAGQLILAARALGYGTVFITDAIPEQTTKEVCNIPDNFKRICITPIGVPVEWPKSKNKKSLDEVVVYDTF